MGCLSSSALYKRKAAPIPKKKWRHSLSPLRFPSLDLHRVYSLYTTGWMMLPSFLPARIVVRSDSAFVVVCR